MPVGESGKSAKRRCGFSNFRTAIAVGLLFIEMQFHSFV